MSTKAIGEVASFANNYPSDLEVALQSGSELMCQSTDSLTISVVLSLDRNEDDTNASNSLQFKRAWFTENKEISWWVLVGNPIDRTILAIKRVSLPNKTFTRQVELDFSAPESTHDSSLSLKVYVLCDSFLGCDQELDFSLLVHGNSSIEEQ